MGEARLYLKATFPNKEHLDNVFPEIQALFDEDVEKASDLYATMTQVLGLSPETAERAVVEKYPDAYAVMRYWVTFSERGEAIQSHFDLPDKRDSELHHDDTTLYYAGMTSHLADWDPLCKFLKDHFGATQCGWISDEQEMDWFALIEME